MSVSIERTAVGLEVQHWPRAVSWLAVIAHVCVTVALWQAEKPRYYADDHHGTIAITILLAQVNLLVVWLVLGSAPLPRRAAWTACGWSAIAFFSLSGERLANFAQFILAAQVVITAAYLAVVRWSGRSLKLHRYLRGSSDASFGDRSQFSIMELFGAALGVAVAAAFLVRIDDPSALLGSFEDELKAILIVCLPAALFTLVAVIGMRNSALLVAQLVLSGVILLLAIAFRTDPHWQWDGVLLSHAAHWFLVGATLWIFQMCGYRFGRKQRLEARRIHNDSHTRNAFFAPLTSRA